MSGYCTKEFYRLLDQAICRAAGLTHEEFKAGLTVYPAQQQESTYTTEAEIIQVFGAGSPVHDYFRATGNPVTFVQGNSVNTIKNAVISIDGKEIGKIEGGKFVAFNETKKEGFTQFTIDTRQTNWCNRGYHDFELESNRNAIKCTACGFVVSQEALITDPLDSPEVAVVRDLLEKAAYTGMQLIEYIAMVKESHGE